MKPGSKDIPIHAGLFETEDGDIPPKRRVHFKWTTWYYIVILKQTNKWLGIAGFLDFFHRLVF
jgi:hypothetical protein